MTKKGSQQREASDYPKHPKHRGFHRLPSLVCEERAAPSILKGRF